MRTCSNTLFTGALASAIAALALLINLAAFGADPGKETTKETATTVEASHHDSAVSNEVL